MSIETPRNPTSWQRELFQPFEDEAAKGDKIGAKREGFFDKVRELWDRLEY